MSIFKGSGVALITPFKNNGEIDYEKLKELIEFQIKNQTDCIIICGTTGESSTMTELEHIACICECVKYVNGRIPVIAGTGSNNTKTAIKLAREAEYYGANGLLCVTPYYNKTNQEGLKKYYETISNNVKIPIIMYNVPSRTGVNINSETANYLCNNYENIVGIKEASGDISKVADLAQNKNIDIYSGNDDETVPILSLGGIGVISVIANIFPKETHDLVMHYLNGEITKSRDMQLNMLNLCHALFSDVNPIPVKKATELLGMTNGYLREPLIELDNEKTEKLNLEIKTFQKIYRK